MHRRPRPHNRTHDGDAPEVRHRGHARTDARRARRHEPRHRDEGDVGGREGAQGQVSGWLIVIVGRDARHQSDDFAMVTAEVLAAEGFSVVLLPDAAPIPVVAFAVRHLRAAAGVQITASHNPRTDNGYKVYFDGGMSIALACDIRIASESVRFCASGGRRRSAATWHGVASFPRRLRGRRCAFHRRNTVQLRQIRCGVDQSGAMGQP